MAATVLFTATPAGADHVAEISADGSRCKLGELASVRGGLGFPLFTDRTSISIDPETGDLQYTCRFDVPAFVPGTERVHLLYGTDWHLPDKAMRFGGFTCWPPGGFNPLVESWDSRMVVTPSGVGIMTCNFPNFVAPTASP